MKKLLVLALAAIMVLSFAVVSMAAATLSGEMQTGFTSTAPDGGKTDMSDYVRGKVVLNGKLGDNVAGTVALRSDGTADMTTGVPYLDEASVTFTESFGTAKFGWYGWNNNLKDIVGVVRNDVKSEFTSSVAINASENFVVKVAYAYKGSDAAGQSKAAYTSLYGIDLGYVADAFGVDVIMTNTGSVMDKDGNPAGTTGLQGYYKMDALKFYLQYETAAVGKDGIEDPVNEVIGLTYEPTDAQIYGRFEYDLSKQDKLGDKANAYGIRFGYKLASGAKIEFQDACDRSKTTTMYGKLIVGF